MTPYLFPVILAGGSGTRLWPLSRKNFPKQFLRLQSESSLLQQTMQRVSQLSCDRTIVVSNDAHYFLCQEQLHTVTTPITYLLEPCPRNTAPAIAATAHYLTQLAGRNAIMLVLPSDHWIADTTAWQQAMVQGIEFAATQDAIVTFGITPSSPKTGYGYIEAADLVCPQIYRIAHFREKPEEALAIKFVEQGHYFWNSGMFVCRAGLYLDELERYASDIFASSAQAYTQAYHHHDFIRLDEPSFSTCRNESIDYAIMEKTDKAVVIPVNMPWSDLGCWTSVAEVNPLDEHGNSLHGKVITKDSHNCLITSENTLVTTLGIKDQIIVATNDAILVADKRYSQQVKDLVHLLGKEHGQLANDHQRVNRPWGYYEILAEGPMFKVKRLMVKSGARLSLQMHQHRAEHWVVVGGTAEVINDTQILHLGVNESTYIPQCTRHRLSNPNEEPLFVIEVQSGVYLGEDDIQRFDDLYQRPVMV